MVQPIDQGSIIRSGQAIVPDYAAQQALQQQMALQQSQQRLAQSAFAQKQQEDQREVENKAAYDDAISNYVLGGGKPDELFAIMARFPKYANELKIAKETGDQAAVTAEFNNGVTIYNFIKSGNLDKAKTLVNDIVVKSRQAGEQSGLEPVAELLNSENPENHKMAVNAMEVVLAQSAGREKFSQSMKDFNPEDKKDPLQKKVEYLRSQGRDDLADAALEEQGLLTVPGAGVFRISDFGRKGGGLASEGGAAPPTSAAPTDIYSITETIESGGNPNAVSPKGARGPMQTMPGTLRDPGFGVTPARDNSVPEMRRVGREYIDAMRGKYQGDMRKAWAAYNWGPGNLDEAIAKHGETGWFAKAPAETRNYVRKAMSMLNKADKAITIKSKQQFEKLASGTVFIAPDGSRRVKP